MKKERNRHDWMRMLISVCGSDLVEPSIKILLWSSWKFAYLYLGSCWIWYFYAKSRDCYKTHPRVKKRRKKRGNNGDCNSNRSMFVIKTNKRWSYFSASVFKLCVNINLLKKMFVTWPGNKRWYWLTSESLEWRVKKTAWFHISLWPWCHQWMLRDSYSYHEESFFC